MIRPGQISVRYKSVSARSPYIRFEGVVELCSRLVVVCALPLCVEINERGLLLEDFVSEC